MVLLLLGEQPIPYLWTILLSTYSFLGMEKKYLSMYRNLADFKSKEMLISDRFNEEMGSSF